MPILSTDIIENDGCPFAGFDKRTEKKKRRTSKESRPKKGIFEIPFCINCINRLFIMKIANHLQFKTPHFFLKVSILYLVPFQEVLVKFAIQNLKTKMSISSPLSIEHR